MPATVIENIKGSELPAAWLKKAREKSDVVFKVTIEPQVKNDLVKKIQSEETNWNDFSLSQAMRGMENEDEPEYTLSDIKESW